MREYDRIAARLSLDLSTGCLEWGGALTSLGYGVVKIDGKIHRVHRIAYEQEKGKIPTGLVVDHLCRNRRCCNPDHLEAVTHRENTLRGNGVSARGARKTHCPKGHPYDEQNTQRRGGFRHCVQCNRERKHRATRNSGMQDR